MSLLKLARLVCTIEKEDDMNFRKPSITKVEEIGEKMNPII